MRLPHIGETWKHEGEDRTSMWLIVSNASIKRLDGDEDKTSVQKGDIISYNFNYFKNNNRWSFHSSKEHLFDELYVRMTR